MTRHDRQAHQLLIVAALIPFVPALISGGTLFGHDAQAQFQYWQGYGFERIAQGTLPTWNPHVLTGTPFAANPQTALFYPPNLRFLVLPAPRALFVSFLLHIYLALLAMYLCLRWHDIPSGAALLGALVHGWGGFTLGHLAAGHLTIIASLPWIPLLLAAMTRWSRTGGRFWFLLGSLSAALLLLSGHPQTTYLGGVLAVAYGLFRFATSPFRRRTGLGRVRFVRQ